MIHRVGKPMHFVYILSHTDGAHKIGVTGDVDARRRTLSNMTPASLKPLRPVASFDLQERAPLIEKVAHREMGLAGYSVEEYEWFQAPAEACIDAVQRAIKLIDEIGPDGWQARRIRAWHQRRKEARHAWKLWGRRD